MSGRCDCSCGGSPQKQVLSDMVDLHTAVARKQQSLKKRVRSEIRAKEALGNSLSDVVSAASRRFGVEFTSSEDLCSFLANHEAEDRSLESKLIYETSTRQKLEVEMEELRARFDELKEMGAASGFDLDKFRSLRGECDRLRADITAKDNEITKLTQRNRKLERMNEYHHEQTERLNSIHASKIAVLESTVHGQQLQNDAFQCTVRGMKSKFAQQRSGCVDWRDVIPEVVPRELLGSLEEITDNEKLDGTTKVKVLLGTISRFCDVRIDNAFDGLGEFVAELTQLLLGTSYSVNDFTSGSELASECISELCELMSYKQKSKKHTHRTRHVM